MSLSDKISETIQKEVSSYVNSKGQKVTSTTEYKVKEFKFLVPKRVELRKNMPHFGDAVNNDASITLQSADYDALESPNAEQEESHLTKPKTFSDKYKSANREQAAETTKAYVPPTSSSSSHIPEVELTTSICISNLPIETTEQDIRDLTDYYGSVKRVNFSRARPGTAYVEFNNRDHAELALKGIHGHPYGNLILNVEWSTNTRSDGGRHSSNYSGYGKQLAQDTHEKASYFSQHK